MLSPNVKKDRRKFGLKKKKSSKGGSVDLTIQFSNKSNAPTDPDNTSPLSVSFKRTNFQHNDAYYRSFKLTKVQFNLVVNLKALLLLIILSVPCYFQ